MHALRKYATTDHLFATLVAIFLLVLLLQPAHAGSVTAKVYDGVQFVQSTTNDAGTPTFDSRPSIVPYEFAPGTGDDQVQNVFADQRSISASSSENLDLAGSLTDAFGATITFGTVKVIEVQASCSNTNNVLVGGAGSNTFVGPFADATDIITVKPCGRLLLMAPKTGWTVTASTGDILKVANSSSGSAVVYTIKILGT
jgi:hypothetical protein